MESILLAVIIGLAVWLFMKNARKMRERKDRLSQPPPDADADAGGASQPKSMPRFGVPRTITREQIARLKENDFEPHRQWSKDEAQLILDSVTYLRAAIRMVTGESGAPTEIQNNILGLILGDEELRDRIRIPRIAGITVDAKLTCELLEHSLLGISRGYSDPHAVPREKPSAARAHPGTASHNQCHFRNFLAC